MEVVLLNYSNRVIDNYSIVLVLVLYLMDSNFSGKCQITNMAKFNSTLIIRDLQYIPQYSIIISV